MIELEEVQRSGCVDAARSWAYDVWDTKNRLVYVGIADNFERRWRQHCDKSWWLNEIVLDHIEVRGYSSRRLASFHEASAIYEQSPIYNTRLESGAYARYLVSDEPCAPVARRFFQQARPLVHITKSTQLSLASIGLWFRAQAEFGERVARADLRSLMPNPYAWHSEPSYADLQSPYEELLAQGFFILDDDGQTIQLSPEGVA